MMKKSLAKTLLPACMILCLVFAGLGLSASPETSREPLRESRDVPRRIISMVPSVTEVVFELGHGNSLVGVSDFSTYPEAARHITRVGGFYNPNLELLTALAPDLVVFQGNHEKVDRFCKQRGIRTLAVDMDSVPTIYLGIQALGETLKARQKARTLTKKIRSELKEVRQSVSTKPRQKVFLCIGRSPGGLNSVFTVGGKSFVSQLLQIAGGENIFSDAVEAYPEAGKESIIARAPDVILELRPGETFTPGQIRRLQSEWDVLRGVPAVENQRIFILTDDALLIPGPRVGRSARAMARAIHKEVTP